jgi:hypothetical protein
MSEMNFEDAPLRPPPVERGDMGRFERRGRKSANNSQTTVIEKKTVEITGPFKPGQSGNPKGRAKGSKNKTTLALRKAILAALDKVGGPDYLARLAIENSSAFASLLGRVLPSTPAPDPDGGMGMKVTFQREIVWPDGHREIEGVTPKQLPAPSPVSVENNDQLICVEKPSQKSASDDQ